MATIVVRFPSLATSLAHAVRYNTNIPDARDMAANESFDTLVDFGSACLSNRRIHAAGGSNSIFCDELLGLVAVVVVLVSLFDGTPEEEVAVGGCLLAISDDNDSAAAAFDDSTDSCIARKEAAVVMFSSAMMY